MANFVLSLSGVLAPLLRGMPPVYRRLLRAKLCRWRGLVGSVDQRLRGDAASDEIHDEIGRLSRIETELTELAPPADLRDEIAHLRLHVAFALDRLWNRLRERTTSPRRAA